MLSMKLESDTGKSGQRYEEADWLEKATGELAGLVGKQK